MKKINRRGFLRLVSAGIGASFLSSCQKEKINSTGTPTAVSITPTSKPATQVPVSVDILGTARGIYPGRVVWSYNAEATRWDGTKGYWWQAQNTDQALVNEMLSQAICQLRGDTRVYSLVKVQYS